MAVDMLQHFPNEHRPIGEIGPQTLMLNEQVQVNPLREHVQPNVRGTPKQLVRAQKIANALRAKAEAKQKADQKAAHKIQQGYKLRL